MTKVLLSAVLACAVAMVAQVDRGNLGKRVAAKSPLDTVIADFEVNDAIVRDALSELSLKGVDGLHLGFEEIIRDKIQDDPRAAGPHFRLHLQNATVRTILDQLCRSDGRYLWSQDGDTIDVYPKGTDADSSYLLGLQIRTIELTDTPDPNQALTPLSRQFPTQQIGYAGPALGDNAYSRPWTTTFENLTVRQFINRIAEHMGSQTSWVWQGGSQERMFTFLKGGFHTSRPNQ